MGRGPRRPAAQGRLVVGDRSAGSRAAVRRGSRDARGPRRDARNARRRGGGVREGGRIITATYEWPIQSHASMGPSCAVADFRSGSCHDLDRLAGHPSVPVHLCPDPGPPAGQGPADLSRRLRLFRHERARGCGRRCRPPVEGHGAAGPRPMEPRGRAWLGPQGPAPPSGSARGRERSGRGRGLEFRGLAAGPDGQSSQRSAPRRPRRLGSRSRWASPRV